MVLARAYPDRPVELRETMTPQTDARARASRNNRGVSEDCDLRQEHPRNMIGIVIEDERIVRVDAQPRGQNVRDNLGIEERRIRGPHPRAAGCATDDAVGLGGHEVDVT